jgi:predicted glycosyltransferase
VDINHPAHVHYSKHIIHDLIRRDHQVIVTARDRDPIFALLESENIEFIDRGKGSNSMLGKALYFIKGDYQILKASIKYKPDLFLCFMSPYAAQVSRVLGKSCVVVDDTEHAKLHDKFTYPFCSTILTPESFYRDLGNKQIRFRSNLELNYLHPNRFKPDPGIFKSLGIEPSQPYVVLRLVAWGGHHDVGQTGISEQVQKEIVQTLSERYKVFISSENPLPEYFKPYHVPLPTDKIHDLLSYASLFIGESGTMASESALLGTPVIYVNSLPLMGYLREAEEHQMLFHFGNDQGVLDKVQELMRRDNLKQSFFNYHKTLLNNKIDGSSFMVWFLENYPESIDIIKQDPEYQSKFGMISS